MPDTYHNYIRGNWVESASGQTFENRNPADAEDLVGLFADSGERDVEQAIEAARSAAEQWRLTPAPHRGEILFRAGRLMEERKEQLARDMAREMGKVLEEARGDVQEGIDMAFYAAGEGRRLFGQTTPSELRNKFNMSVRMPVGLCTLITPWNFPMAIPTWKIMPALVCGNTIIFKPASDTPLSAINLVKVLEDAGLPKGVLNLITGSGSKIGTPLTTHPDIDLVSFTGSTEVGRIISRACAEDLKQVSLEMGGKNVIIVMNDANLDLAIDGALWGAFGTSGQRCTAASRIIVQQKVSDSFTQSLVERARALRVGNGLNEKSEVGPVINASQMEIILNYIEIGKEEGAELICGGERITADDLGRGYFIQPTIFSHVQPQMRIAQEEIFGPVVSILETETLEQAIQIANGVEYGLSASIYTHDVNSAFKAMRDIYTGVFYVNAPTIGAEIHLPFGGTKSTGNGHREAGEAALDIFTEWKSIYVDYSDSLQRAQIDLENF